MAIYSGDIKKNIFRISYDYREALLCNGWIIYCGETRVTNEKLSWIISYIKYSQSLEYIAIIYLMSHLKMIEPVIMNIGE